MAKSVAMRRQGVGGGRIGFAGRREGGKRARARCGISQKDVHMTGKEEDERREIEMEWVTIDGIRVAGPHDAKR